MGKVTELRCKKCGCVWQHFSGVGMMDSPEEIQQEIDFPGTVNNEGPVCPDCGSTEYEETGLMGLWD